MNSEILMNVGMDVAKSAVAVAVVTATGLTDYIGNGEGLVQASLKYGTLYAGANDLVNGAIEGNSKILSWNVRGFADDVGFFSGLSAGVFAIGADAMGYDTLAKVSPLAPAVNAAIINGSIVSAGKVLGNFIDRSPDISENIKLLRHPTRLFM